MHFYSFITAFQCYMVEAIKYNGEVNAKPNGLCSNLALTFLSYLDHDKLRDFLCASVSSHVKSK